MERIEYKNYMIEIEQDEFSDSPREWDNLGTMVCFHSRYNLGDKHSMSIEEAKEFSKRKDIFVLPLYLYDHSGLVMDTARFSCPWDSGQVGFIYVTKEAVKKEWKVAKISGTLKMRIESILRAEVQTYSDYLGGNVYHYHVTNKDGEFCDSCGGFYGYDHEKSGLLEYAKGAIDADIENRKELRQRTLKTLIKNNVPLDKRENILSKN